MTEQEIKIGQKVRSLRAFESVPKGAFGYIIDDYGTGITIGWDLPELPYPHHLKTFIIAALFAINTACPLRDGFDKKTELDTLEIVEGMAKT